MCLLSRRIFLNIPFSLVPRTKSPLKIAKIWGKREKRLFKFKHFLRLSHTFPTKKAEKKAVYSSTI